MLNALRNAWGGSWDGGLHARQFHGLIRIGARPIKVEVLIRQDRVVVTLFEQGQSIVCISGADVLETVKAAIKKASILMEA